MLTDEDKAWISAKIEVTETKLLTAFHQWASPLDMRQRVDEAALRALDTEVESLGEQITKLESR